MNDYPDSAFQEAVQDEIRKNEQRKLYDLITQAYFEDNETEFDGVEINDLPLLKTVAYLLDASITISEAENASITTLMWNFIEIEIQTLQRMQRVFE